MSAAAKAPLPPNLAAAAEMMALPSAYPVASTLHEIPEPLYPFLGGAAIADSPLPPNLFRDPDALMPILAGKSGYVVYLIAAHGMMKLPSPMKDYVGTPYSVIQTGGGDTVGCAYYTPSINLLKNLFSINLPYSFQYLLGRYNDRLPRVYRDLIYTTNTEETLPDRHLLFKESPGEAPFAGVFQFDPEESGTAGTPLFIRDRIMDSIIKTGKGSNNKLAGWITLSDLIDKLMLMHNGAETSYKKRENPRPAIFVLASCASFIAKTPFANKNLMVRRCASCHFYSEKSNARIPYFPLNEEMGPLPSFVKPANIFNTSHIKNWTRPPLKTMRQYYNRKAAATAKYLGRVAAGKNTSGGKVKISGQRERWERRNNWNNRTHKKKHLGNTNRTRRLPRVNEDDPLPNYESENDLLPNYETPPASQEVAATGGSGTGGGSF
jgi:hypothetical protein